MPTWSRTLDEAGVSDPLLRRDYTEQRRLVARFARAEYMAVRLLLPAAVVPDVIAATAFMHHSDNLIDQGPLDERLKALESWEIQVKDAFDGSTDQSVLRALVHTSGRHAQLEGHVQAFLNGAPAEVQWEGFDTDDDFRRYVDAYSHPAFMLIACLLEPPAQADAYRTGCRTFIESSQRLDFLEDLADDLGTGRLGLSQESLAAFGITRAQLERGESSEGLQKLICHQVELIRPGLVASQSLADLVDPRSRQFMTALVSLQQIRLQKVEEAGVSLLRKSPSKPIAASFRELARAYLAARRAR
ncbi:squalene/phytoene synthase family protein [Streptomyces sp. NPDC055709]